jgi:hypothetical protein
MVIGTRPGHAAAKVQATLHRIELDVHRLHPPNYSPLHYVTSKLYLPLDAIIQSLTRHCMNDITANGHIVRFNISETFLRSDDKARLETIEKMLTLGLIDLEQAKEMEDLTPNGNESGDAEYINSAKGENA